MKLLTLIPFVLERGTNKDTLVKLPTTPGLFFQVFTGAYESALFTGNIGSVPVTMTHADRDSESVVIKATNNTVTISQVYRMSSQGYVFVWVNDDWTDTDQLSAVAIDAKDVISVTLTNGSRVTVNTSFNGAQIRLTSTNFNPANTTYYGSLIHTENAAYTYPISFTTYRDSDNNPRYIYADIPRVITAYARTE